MSPLGLAGSHPSGGQSHRIPYGMSGFLRNALESHCGAVPSSLEAGSETSWGTPLGVEASHAAILLVHCFSEFFHCRNDHHQHLMHLRCQQQWCSDLQPHTRGEWNPKVHTHKGDRGTSHARRTKNTHNVIEKIKRETQCHNILCSMSCGPPLSPQCLCSPPVLHHVGCTLHCNAAPGCTAVLQTPGHLCSGMRFLWIH